MYIVKKTNTNHLTPTSSTVIEEYPMDEPSLSGATAQINGRYPVSGFAMNKLCKELVFILSGTGSIVTNTKTESFNQGDTIFIDAEEKYYWVGNFRMFMATAPRFSADQHTIIE